MIKRREDLTKQYYDGKISVETFFKEAAKANAFDEPRRQVVSEARKTAGNGFFVKKANCK